VSRFVRDTGALILGRGAAYLIAIAIPIALVRLLDPVAFGSYKQIFLIYGTLFLILQFGMAESLYYFLPDAPERRGAYLVQTLLFLGGSGAAAAAALWLAAPAVAAGFDNPRLAGLLPIAGLFVFGMMLSYPLEMVLIIERRGGWAALAYVGSEAAKAAAMIVPLLWSGELAWLLWGLVGFAALRLAVLAAYLHRGGLIRAGGVTAPLLDGALFRRQWAYAFPFGLAGCALLLQTSLDQYVVAARFDAAAFAVYAVGLFQIPIVELVGTVTASTFMVELARLRRAGAAEPALGLWHRVTGSLAWLAFPIFAFGWTLAEPLITLLFTAQYRASVPIFRVALAGVLLAPFLTDAVLRVHGDTGRILSVGLARLGVTAAVIAPALAVGGLPGAAAAGVLGHLAAKLLMLRQVGRRLEVGWERLLPWGELGRTAACAAAAALPLPWVAARFAGAPLGAVLGGGAAFVTVYLLGLYFTAPQEQRRVVRSAVAAAASLRR
jgi:O-antigen/teichoic acid export membrane protein